MIDQDGYPTEETLKRISGFDIMKEDPFEFAEYLCDNWVNGFPPKWNPKTGGLELHTGGWSGCESIISALESSKGFPTFWGLYWYKSVRGGHYWFKVKRIKK